jgi:hypothetical protein
VAEMGLAINALPHTFVLFDKLPGVALQKTVHFVDVFSFVRHYTKDSDAELEAC